MNWYNLPTYYDVSFSHEMREELLFLKTLLIESCNRKHPRVLEPACGTGRLIVPLCKSGFDCSGFDINKNTLRYLQQKLKRKKLHANLFEADMTSFLIQPRKFDAAYCTVDTFRHLLSERDAVHHLNKVAAVLKKGGIYIIGLHLLPKQGISNKVSRWTARRGRLTVNTTMTLVELDNKNRTETLCVKLKTDHDKRQYESVYKLRTYSLKQFNRLIEKTGQFKIANIYDHHYDLSSPVKLNERSDYGVFILRRV